MSETLRLVCPEGVEPKGGNTYVIVDTKSSTEQLWRGHGYVPEEEAAAVREAKAKGKAGGKP